MKKAVIFSIVLMTIACKKEISNEGPGNTRAYNSAEQLGKGVITALQQHSQERYLELGLSFNDFQTFMEMEAKAYKMNPEKYKQETDKNYQDYFIPELKKSFELIDQQSRSLNIRWEDAKFISVETASDVNKEREITIAPIEINFSYHGKNAQLLIKKAIVMNGKWMISQFTELK